MYINLMESACGFFERQMTEDLRCLLANKYGFTRETITASRIGFAPVGSGDLLAYLFDRCDDRDLLLRSGLFYQTSYSIRPLWQGRIIFPYRVQRIPQFFIGREVNGITCDGLSGKYIKQRVHSGKNPDLLPVEPIFGIDTILQDAPLLIVEGIADAIACHQAGYSAISPVTTRFKEKHCKAVSELCEHVSRVVIIMDSEQNEAGIIGACKTAYDLLDYGITSYIAELPRPDQVEKIDIADFTRSGGDLESIIKAGVICYDHPKFQAIKNEKWAEASRKFANQIRKVTRKRVPDSLTHGLGYTPKKIDAQTLRRHMPDLEYFTGIRSGERGSHPVYGSSSGTNLEMSADGERWFCYHEGSRGDGDVFKWIAVYELRLISESDRLDGIAWITTLQHCWRKYGPVHKKENHPCEPVREAI